MIELRWLEVETGKKLMNEHGWFYQETKKILQYRQQFNATNYGEVDELGSGGFVTCTSWSTWEEVPTVISTGESK